MLALTLATVSGIPGWAAEQPWPELIVLGAPVKRAELVGLAPNGALRFRDADGRAFSVKLSQLVRWSTPAPLRAVDEIILADGSRLGLAAAWGKEPALLFDGTQGVARTAEFGRIECDRLRIREILWGLPSDEARRTQIIDELVATTNRDDESDVLMLDNGDLMTGKLVRIGPSERRDDDDAKTIVAFDGKLGLVELLLARVRGVRLSPQGDPQPSEAQAKSTLVVGLRDGSRIAAETIRGEGERLAILSPILGELALSRLEEVVSLQAVGDQVEYLSGVEPVSYRHEPYLDLAWPYRRDRNVLGGPLRAGDRSYLKGLGMHSASRLTFDLGAQYDRFAAAVALDDAAEDRGSVVFRVFLKSDGAWREAYASGVVRSGEPPKEVTVDLDGAKQLALVVDYADRGDERDYANWLDARLERP